MAPDNESILDKHTESLPSQSEKFRQIAEPAAQARRIIRFLNENPFAPNEEVRRATGLENRQLVEQAPELVYLASHLLTVRTAIRKVHEVLSQESGNSQKMMAQILFEAARPEGSNGKAIFPEELAMASLSNPFALFIVASGRNFQQLHSPDSRGYFRARLELPARYGNLQTPFIAVRSEGTEEQRRDTSQHEFGHAYAYAVYKGLMAVEKEDLWGPATWSQEPLASFSSKANYLRGLWNSIKSEKLHPGLITERPEWKAIQNLQFAIAKNEIIARLFEVESLEVNEQPLYVRGSTYDKISKIQSGNSDFADYLWYSYTETLNRFVKPVVLIDKMLKQFDLRDRRRFVAWFLMRVPIEKWPQTLSETGLLSEAMWLQEINKFYLKSRGTPVSSRVMNTSRRPRDPLTETFERHKAILKQRPWDELILPEIQTMQEDLAKAAKR